MNELIRNINNNIPLNTIIKLPSGQEYSITDPITENIIPSNIPNMEIADSMSRDFTTGAIETFSPLASVQNISAQDNSMLSSFAEQIESVNAFFSLEPMIFLELAAISFTLLYLVQQMLLKQSEIKLSFVSFRNFTNSFTEDVLEYVNVGNLISWPKRSLSNQRVCR